MQAPGHSGALGFSQVFRERKTESEEKPSCWFIGLLFLSWYESHRGASLIKETSHSGRCWGHTFLDLPCDACPVLYRQLQLLVWLIRQTGKAQIAALLGYSALQFNPASVKLLCQLAADAVRNCHKPAVCVVSLIDKLLRAGAPDAPVGVIMVTIHCCEKTHFNCGGSTP